MSYEDELRAAAQRSQTAKRMSSFYEPGFGGSRSGYGNMLGMANTMPTTMGGFDYRPDVYRGTSASYAARGLGGPVDPEFTDQMQKSWALRSAYDAPPVGVANLGRYGVGQLKNYGTGALSAYGPMIREETLRWR